MRTIAWWVFVVVCGLLTTQHGTHEGRGEAKPELSISIVTRAGARIDHASVHGGPGSRPVFALVGDFDARDPRTVHRGSPFPSLRLQGQAVAAELLTLAMRAEGLADADVAAALDVSRTLVRGLRHGLRPLAVGDLIVFQRRLPALAALLLGAFAPLESP